SPVPLNNLGLVLEAAGRTGEAIEQYEQALVREPQHPDFLGNRVRAKIRAGERSPETAAILQEVVFRTTRPQWREWAEEQLATSHLAFAGAIVCEPQLAPPLSPEPAPDTE